MEVDLRALEAPGETAAVPDPAQEAEGADCSSDDRWESFASFASSGWTSFEEVEGAELSPQMIDE